MKRYKAKQKSLGVFANVDDEPFNPEYTLVDRVLDVATQEEPNGEVERGRRGGGGEGRRGGGEGGRRGGGRGGGGEGGGGRGGRRGGREEGGRRGGREEGERERREREYTMKTELLYFLCYGTIYVHILVL